MDFDTGASVSLIREDVFHQMQDSAELLQESKAELFTCTGESICVVGCMDANVKPNGQIPTLPLIVTHGKGLSLQWSW